MFSHLASKFYYWHVFMGLVVFNFALFMAGTYSQYLYISQEKMPEYLSQVLTEADWKAMQAKSVWVLCWFFFDCFITSVLPAIIIGFNLIPKAWAWFQRGTTCCHDNSEGRAVALTTSCYFYGVYTLIMTLLVYPLYELLRTASWGTITPVQAIVLLVQTLITLVILLIISYFPRRKYLVCAVDCILTSALPFAFTFFNVSQLMDEFQRAPLDPNSSGVFKLLQNLQFPTERFLFIPKVVRAFTTGFGSNAVVVIGGGLIDMLTPREYEAVIAHELGHWRYHHMLIFSSLFAIILLLQNVFAYFVLDRPRFYRAFGFNDNKHVPLGVGLILFQLFMAQLKITPTAFFFISQQCEYAADAHSARLGYGAELISALTKLTRYAPVLSLRTKFWGFMVATHPDLYDRALNIHTYM